MKRFRSLCLVAALYQLLSVSLVGQESLLEGVWRADLGGLPALVITISNEGGDLRGAILFFLIRRDTDRPASATATLPEPLFHLKFDGASLEFQVSHRRAHPPRTAHDAPVTFRLTITGTNEGWLVREGIGTEEIRVHRQM